MNRISAFLSVTFAVVLFAILTLDATYDRHNGEQLFKAPSVSALNTQEYAQSILQDAEKDIVFIENLGQITDTEGEKRPDILFLTRSEGVDMYMTNSGISYVFRNAESGHYRLDMEFDGMNKNITIKKELAVEQQYHYYTPEYPDGISPNAYKKLTMENIYEGIDLVYYEKEGRMKYDFILKAGADAGKIKMKYKGAGSIDIDNNGNVIVTTPMGEIREEKPYTFSRNTGSEIESSYRVKNNTVLFDIAEYDESEDIIIDPVRIWATYYGGSGDDAGNSICTDDSGNLYLTGKTEGSNFPTQTLTGAYNQTTNGGSGDAYILKFNSSGARIWATFYGGNGWDYGTGICTDISGNLYATGYTQSSDFPTQTLTGAYNQTTHGGDADVFILKFNSSGARIWATYYGGNVWDYGTGICTDNLGNLYVTGRTEGSNFPKQTLTGAYNQTTYGGGDNDAFILKFNSSGARIWATYYGGGDDDRGWNTCTDISGNLYVTGRTASSNFPTQTLTGAYNQTALGGTGDVFILKFNSSGARHWATYYGGSVGDVGRGMCADNSGNFYVTGRTASSDFPTQTLTGVYNQTTYGGGNYDAFILKFNSSGARIWATYYGGSSDDRGVSACTDNSGHLYVVGYTQSSNFPTLTLTGSYNQTTIGGSYDAFILKFNSSSARIWASYYGGTGSEGGWSTRGSDICTDNSGNLYVTGNTESSDFPTLTLTGAYNQNTSYGYDAFILWFEVLNAAFNASDDTICAGSLVNFTDQSTGYVISWDWAFEGGTPSTSTSQHPTVTYNTTGIFDVQLIITDGTYSDTLLNEDYITVLETPGQADEPDGNTAVCTNNTYTYTTLEVDFTQDYEWELSPADAGTLTGTDTIATLEVAEDWTGDFSIRVRAINICGDGDWSDYFEGTVYQTPDEYTLEGGGGYCVDGEGVEITLDGSQTDVDYELYLDGEATGNIVEGTGSEISFSLVTDEGYYTCMASNDNCSQMMMNQIQVYLLYPPSETGTPTGPEVICEETTADYETSGSEDADSYEWMLSPEEAGTIAGDGLTATVEWSEGYSGTAYISVYGINACGDGNPSEELEVSVGAPNPLIEGEDLVCDWSDEFYEVADNEGSTYTWEVNGGMISDGQGTCMITVSWCGEGDGTISVEEETADGCSGSSEDFEVTIDDCTGIGELEKEGRLTISPNPFKNTTIIKFQLEQATEVTIYIYNHMGELVDLIEEYKPSGKQKVTWNADKLPSGVYYFRIATGRLEAGEQFASGKAVRVR